MIEFDLQGMKCQSCVAKITNALMKDGYQNVSVTLSPPKVRIENDAPVSEENLQRTIIKAGDYTIKEATPAHSAAHDSHVSQESEERLTPLFVILSYITAGVALRACISGNFSFALLMNNFMGGFLVVFSLFKLLNLNGFAEAYATYDIIAARSRVYALVYPFIELLLGVSYFVGFSPLLTNLSTAILMAIGSIGVYYALKSKRKFQCACLGTALKLPMTKVTLVEDVTMELMALVMVFHNAALL